MIRFFYIVYRIWRRLDIWARRRFTPAGWFVLGGLTLGLLVAVDVEQTVGYQAVVILFCLGVVSASVAPFFRIRFKVDRLLPRFGTIDEPFTYRVRVTNLTRRWQRGLEYLEDIRDTVPSYREFRERLKPGKRSKTFRLSDPLPGFRKATAVRSAMPPLPPGGTVEIRVQLLPLRRGVLHLAGAYLTRADPLGLFRSLRRQLQSQTVLILPRRYPVAPVSFPGNTQYQQGGVAFASGVGESEEFVGLREYRRGDSLRRIHWRSTARVGEPIVKEYQDEFFVRYALVLDTFCDPSMDPVFEQGVSVAASFACTVPDQESLLDLLFVGTEAVCVTAGRGVGHVEQMLEVLAAAAPSREPRFDKLHRVVLGHSQRLSGCILVMIGYDRERRRLVEQLQAIRMPLRVIILVPEGMRDSVEIEARRGPLDRFVIIASDQIAEGLREL